MLYVWWRFKSDGIGTEAQGYHSFTKKVRVVLSPLAYNGLAKKRSHLITLQIGTKLYWLCFLAVVVVR